MKRTLILAVTAMVLTVGQLTGAPARRELITIEQPDGTEVKVRLYGDEYYHYYMTESGEYVTRGNDGFIYYTEIDEDDNLKASSVRVNGDVLSDVDNIKIAHKHAELYNRNRTLRQSDRIASQAPMRRAAAKASSTSSEVKGLIILVNFSDKSFVTSQSTIDKMMNDEGYTDSYGAIGSARDYFNAQSYGQFVPDFDVVGPVTLSKKMSYYGGNDRNGVDQYPDVMVSEACELASEQGLVDMSDYDLDGDGWVDLVYVIYAGYAENSGAPSSTVWPHAWYIYQGAGRTVQVDGVYLDAYACSSELASTSGSKYDGIGTFCHEYSHTLGLPDFYDIDYSGAMGMSDWSVMDGGCYAMDGYIPISYNAFERYSCGWISLNELSAPATIEMPHLDNDAQAAYRISTDDNNKFITLETRVNEGWDVGLPAAGMMVTAIDYDATVWNRNAPNDDPSRQRVKLIPADNDWREYSLYGDLYPFEGNAELTSTSSPAMRVYTTVIDKPVTNIAFNNGVVTFDFMGGAEYLLDAPVATAAANVASDRFTAYWSPVSGATSYELYVERVEDGILFEENFDGFISDASTDVSETLDNYTTIPGWIGYKVFCNDGEVKLGSSQAGGTLGTPVFPVLDEGHTIYFDASSYNEEAESGILTLAVEYNEVPQYLDVEMTNFPCDQITTIGVRSNAGSSDCRVILYGDTRIYIDNLRVVNGIDNEPASQRAIYVDATTGEITPARTSSVQRAQAQSESYTFKGITDTHYTVTKVISEVSPGTYRYKVRAVSDEGISEWSNIIEVVIDDVTNTIENVEDSHSRAYAADGIIYVENIHSLPVVIYNMQGAIVAHMPNVSGMVTYEPVASGIYIVRYGNEVAKVVVK